MAAYVPMSCEKCRRQQQRYANSRRCACGGRLRRCAGPVPGGPLTFAAATGAVIRRARLSLDMTAREMCRLSGLSAAFVSDVERGVRGIGLDSFLALADVLGVSPGRLIGSIQRLTK